MRKEASLPIGVDALRQQLVEESVLQAWEHHDTIDSTNRRAAVLGREGAAGVSLVTAECQSAGRGRQGRVWESPARRNFYGSFVLRPKVAQANLAPITLVAALAVAEALATMGVADAQIKWPNDVLLQGRKVAGILTELDHDVAGGFFVVVGIGVNLNLTTAEFPPELRDKATSVAEHSGAVVDRTAFVAALARCLVSEMSRFEQRGFAGMREAYESRHVLQGQEVRVTGGESLTGRVLGIDEGGALLLSTARGPRAVHAGEVSLASTYGNLPKA